MKDVLAAVAALRLDAPVAAGDVLIEDVCGTGVAVVATKKRMLSERDPRRAVVDGKGFRYER